MHYLLLSVKRTQLPACHCAEVGRVVIKSASLPALGKHRVSFGKGVLKSSYLPTLATCWHSVVQRWPTEIPQNRFLNEVSLLPGYVHKLNKTLLYFLLKLHQCIHWPQGKSNKTLWKCFSMKIIYRCECMFIII